jgi:NADH dehydrogenase
MKVFVTGGTGFVGTEVVAQLRTQGHSVRLLVRSASPSAHRPDLEIVSGDILQSEILKQAVAGCEAIVHLVGIISEAGARTFERIHVSGTHNMIEAAKAAGVKRFLHMSALGTRPNARSRYHQTKWLAEELVRSSGLQWTIFRPSLVFGPRDAFVNLYAKLLSFAPVVPLLGNPTVKFQPVSVQDVAGVVAAAVTDPASSGKTFDLVGSEAFTLREIVKRIARRSGHKAILWHVPNSLAVAQAYLMELIYGRILSRPPPLNRDQLVMLQENNIGDNTAACEQFGLKPMDFETGIARYLK